MAAAFLKPVYAAADDLSADAVYVVSLSTGEPLYDLHAERKLTPGGFARIMTATVVIDRMHDDSEYRNVITISPSAASKGQLLHAGDKLSVKDLLYALILENSDEAATALAIYSSGSESAFVDAMNSKAQELGLRSTHYASPRGETRAQQYTSAQDTAALIRHSMDIRMMEKIRDTNEYRIEGKAKRLTILHRSPSISYDGLERSEQYPLTRSGKTVTGYAVARRDGMQLIAVSMNTSAKTFGRSIKALLDDGFHDVTRQQIVKAKKRMGVIRVRHGAHTILPVVTKYKGYVYVPKEGTDSLIRTETVLRSHLEAPVRSGTKAGEYRIYVADELTGTVDLIVTQDVPTGWLPSYLYISNLTSVLIGVVLAFFLWRVHRRRVRRKKRRQAAARRRQQKIRDMARTQFEIEEDRRRRNWTYH